MERHACYKESSRSVLQLYSRSLMALARSALAINQRGQNEDDLVTVSVRTTDRRTNFDDANGIENCLCHFQLFVRTVVRKFASF